MCRAMCAGMLQRQESAVDLQVNACLGITQHTRWASSKSLSNTGRSLPSSSVGRSTGHKPRRGDTHETRHNMSITAVLASRKHTQGLRRGGIHPGAGLATSCGLNVHSSNSRFNGSLRQRCQKVQGMNRQQSTGKHHTNTHTTRSQPVMHN